MHHNNNNNTEEKGNESDSSGEGVDSDLRHQQNKSTKGGGSTKKNVPPKKRFLQLYTSKAYGSKREQLVQPHDNDNVSTSPPSSSSTSSPSSPSSSKSRQLTLRRTSSAATLELDQEHVLSPRIVEAVTHSTQVVWANCQKNEGLLGRSDMKLQTAIGMPVGVDESGNVWVVVMFSPKNVESSTDAIDYLQYISRSAASTSIPCLLPVVGDTTATAGGEGGGGNDTKMICNGDATANDDDEEQSNLHHVQSLVSIKPDTKQPDHTEEIGDGVTAKFVSFNINDAGDENGKAKTGSASPPKGRRSSLTPENDLRDAPKDDWGIPMLPDSSAMEFKRQSSLLPDAIDNAITDAFDEASYGVWSTIMNSAGGDTIRTSELIATKMHLIQERLEEFATAFLGMSVFDVADAWTVSTPDFSEGGVKGVTNPILKCLFTVAGD